MLQRSFTSQWGKKKKLQKVNGKQVKSSWRRLGLVPLLRNPQLTTSVVTPESTDHLTTLLPEIFGLVTQVLDVSPLQFDQANRFKVQSLVNTTRVSKTLHGLVGENPVLITKIMNDKFLYVCKKRMDFVEVCVMPDLVDSKPTTSWPTNQQQTYQQTKSTNLPTNLPTKPTNKQTSEPTNNQTNKQANQQ